MINSNYLGQAQGIALQIGYCKGNPLWLPLNSLEIRFFGKIEFLYSPFFIRQTN